MTISLRLDPQLAQQLNDLARRRGVSKSAVIRECLQEMINRQASRPSPWEIGKDLFGKVAGPRDLASRRKRIVRERLHDRSRRR